MITTLRGWMLDMLAIVVGVILAELLLDAWHARQSRMLDG